jgi:phosphate transport system permease protein
MSKKKTLIATQIKDTIFKKLLIISSLVVIGILLGLCFTLLTKSALSLKDSGVSFLFRSIWDPVRDLYGAFPFLVGTLITSILALVISIPFSLAIAIFLGSILKEGLLSSLLGTILDLLAGIPSVIYGFWGLFVLVPIIRTFELWIGVAPNGVGIITASIILALMIIPYSASISREMISLVPKDLNEAALSLGATPLESINKVTIPYAKSGIFAGILMSFGRAISETMAVTMLIGNSNKIPLSIFSPANTLASVIANEFAEASEALYVSSLIELALLLLVLTTLFSLGGRIIVKKWAVPI